MLRLNRRDDRKDAVRCCNQRCRVPLYLCEEDGSCFAFDVDGHLTIMDLYANSSGGHRRIKCTRCRKTQAFQDPLRRQDKKTFLYLKRTMRGLPPAVRTKYTHLPISRADARKIAKNGHARTQVYLKRFGRGCLTDYIGQNLDQITGSDIRLLLALEPDVLDNQNICAALRTRAVALCDEALVARIDNLQIQASQEVN